MGLGDIGDFDADSARYDRLNRTQSSEFAPGQGGTDLDSLFNSNNNESVGDSSGMGDIFGGGVSGGDNPFGGDPFGNPFGGMQQQQVQQPKSDEDKFWDAVSKGASGGKNFLVAFTKSFGQCTPRFWAEYGKAVTIVSIVSAIVGIVLRVFGIKLGMKLAIGSAISGGFGIFMFLWLQEKALQFTSPYKDGGTVQQPQEQPQSDPFSGSGFEENTSDDNNWGDNNDDWGSSDDWGDNDDDWGDGESDSEDDFEDDDWDDFEPEEPSSGMSTEEALATAQTFEKGMYVRAYLYDMFTKTLPTLTPSFAHETVYDEDSDEFLYWGEQLQDAATVSGCKEEWLPELQELKENLFTVTVVCDRPNGLKVDTLAQELANIYEASESEANNVSAKAKTIGTKCVITIYTGKSAMISLKDMYNQVEDWMKDEKNYIPVVLGVGTDGEILKVDFKKLESIIITGMPRSGKSWFCQAVLYQMCAFVPPTQLHLYICDPKEGISDFKAFVLPHVKKFVSNDAKIVETLRQLVKVEGPRRKKIIGDAGFVNIWDYKEKFPDVKLPVIYVIVDEVVTLASRMDKETNNEFRMLLRELISQLPALGIRAFLIPHVLNNDIIEKKTSDLVPCKISVCGDADHIEKATGSKFKDFPHKLVNKGDMAVRMPLASPDTMFVHSPALTDSNPKNNELFEYARRVWKTLEPEEEADSVAADADKSSENKELLNRLQADEDLDLF